MQYARLGETGLVVSKLALGSMTFGAARDRPMMAAIYKLDQAGADRLTAEAIDAGVNHFNSADVYSSGDSETMLGKALGARRQDVVISTKVGNRMGPGLLQAGLSRRRIVEAAEASLKRLGTDYIDVYLAHRVDPHTPLEETLEAFDALVRQGKVRYAGFSNWPAWMAATARGIQQQRGYEPFRAAEMYYSLVGRDLEAEVVPWAEQAGCGLIVWSPLAGGFLSGKYTREDPSGGGGRLSGFDMIPFDREQGYRIVEVLKAVAERQGATPAAIALAWLMTRPAVSSVLVGASSSQQLAANLAAAAIRLTDQDVAELDQVSAIAPRYPGWFSPIVRDGPVEKALAG
ncbi:aldo/keto reductase [Phenylobacterium montanum]|uniref:Aldo/keto reductase n=1 Tax=Phenylobacterium montanum TaxID=2823693 RepID=A0A975G3V1_9CAUL|nr:aldo/keto reductase [Caulobacter sp. S6]QUD90054.1 aldo/keto reductase [Caulobacter sp. S6]